jgi:hypothetical protein
MSLRETLQRWKQEHKLSYIKLFSIGNNIEKKCLLNPIRLLLVFVIVMTLFIPIKCDCGSIKLLNKMKEYDGENADVLKGRFDGYLDKEYTISGFLKILGTDIKNYSIFKFSHYENASNPIELLNISFSKYNNKGEEVNLLISNQTNHQSI